LDHFEEHLQHLVEVIKHDFRQAEVYLLDELAAGQRESANKMHLAVVLPESPSEELKQRGEEKIRQSAKLAPHHPLKISFLSQTEKERHLQGRSKRCLTCPKG